MTKLIDPIEIAMAAREQETANLTTHRDCPVCGVEMMRVLSLGEPARFCKTHNIVLPELPE